MRSLTFASKNCSPSHDAIKLRLVTLQSFFSVLFAATGCDGFAGNSTALAYDNLFVLLPSCIFLSVIFK